MSELPPLPTEPTTSPRRSRRGLIIAVVAALVAVGLIIVGVQVGLQVLNSVREQSAAVPDSSAEPDTAADSETPVLYTSEAEGYSIEAPGEVHAETSEGQTLTQVQTLWGEGRYYVGTIDFSDYEDEIDPDTVLERSADLMLQRAPGTTVRESEKVTFNGAPAIVGILDVPGAGGTRFVVAFHNNVQYGILVYEFDDDRDENFIDSFTYLD
jgi:hypothetical protein